MPIARLAAALTLALCGFSMAQAAAPPAGPANEGRPEAGASLRIETGLEYARVGAVALKLDLYRMDPSSTPQPVVVWIHGEGDLDARTASPAAGLVGPGGFAVASIDYRTGPGVTTAMQLSDVKAAVRWLRANAAAKGLDPGHVGVMGYGRGGQLAALAGVTSGVSGLDGGDASAARVQAVVDLAGPVTSGGLNPAAHVTADDAPFLIIHGTADAAVSTRESQVLVAALKVGKVAAQLDMPVAVTHDLGALLSPTTLQSISSFFAQNLRGARIEAALSSFVATPPGTYIDPVALDLGGTQYKLYPSPSRGPGTMASYRIYLPPGYEQNPRRRYPVIYFLHGRSVDSKRPITAGYIARADAAIRSGVMPPTIIVLVQGLNTGWYMDDQAGRFPIESVIVRDLIPHVDASYRTVATRAGRAIEGHSMGGFGALRLGFKYADRFVAVTGNSPANILDVTDDMGDQAFWERQSIAAIARANAEQVRRQKIRVIIGDQDGLLPSAKLVSDLLTELRAPHSFTPVAGSPHNHDQLLQYETFDTMAFYGEVFAPFRAAGDPPARP